MNDTLIPAELKVEKAAVEPLVVRQVPLSPLELQRDSDWNWALGDPAIRRQYARQVVAVAHQRVWGSGADHGQAYIAARRNVDCPERKELTFVVVPEWLDAETDK